jgi:serine/threonine-protein kinase
MQLENAISRRYQIEEEIGRGGMAVVYRAIDTALGRPVAIKVLHPHLQSHRESRMRFAREAQAVAKLHHPNIVEIYDYSGEESEAAYIVTEHIRGETLDAFLQRRRLRLPETGLLLAAPLCEALAHAHALGIIHRDIKPGNVMIREDGAVKLTDFGIAQVLDAPGLTVTGTLLGSPAHMSPEHIDGRPLDHRADVFSLGTVLYLVTVGELPFQGRNPHAVMKAILEGEYRRPQAANARVSLGLERILCRALDRDPGRRYEAVDLLLLDLRAYLGDVGVHDVPSEVRAFFADPDGYEEALQRRIVAARLRRGREALARRRHAHALEDFNQVLALDPRNWEVLALLGRMGRRQALERAGLAVLVAGALSVGAWWLLGEPPAPVPTPPAAAPAAPTAPARLAAPVPPVRARPATAQAARPTSPALEASRAPPATRVVPRAPRGRAPGAPVRPRGEGPPRRLARLERRAPAPAEVPSAPPEPAPPSPALEPSPEPAAARAAPPPAGAPPPEPAQIPLAPREVRINTWPKAVKIFVDGREVGWAGIVNRIDLMPGRHRIRLESPSCHPQEIDLSVPADGPVAPIVARLAWRPGLLVVDNPQNADVSVDGVYKGTSHLTGAEPILVHIDKSNPRGRVKVHVRLSKAGFQQEDRVEEIAAGRRTVVRVSLKPQ